MSDTPQKFRKKPVIIEAIQWTGINLGAIHKFVGKRVVIKDYGAPISVRELNYDSKNSAVIIHTLEGDMKANVGDWIIKGVKNEMYPCKPDIFEAAYESTPPTNDD